jgi:hypothetical protein
VGDPQAQYLVVAMGSSTETIHETVDYLVKKIESLHERKRLGMEHFDSYETDIAEVMQIIETLELTI